MTADLVTARPGAAAAVTPAQERAVSLICHAASPCALALAVTVNVKRLSPTTLQFRYTLDGPLHRVRIAASGPVVRADELWRSTCFEAFFGRAGEDAYGELNFSPSRAWAAYRFSSYRAGMTPLAADAPQIAVDRKGDSFVLAASVALPVKHGESARPAAERESALQLALSAVIESDDGALSYWALRHPAAKPDFHLREGFVLEI